MKDRNIINARFIQVNQLHQIDSHLIAKLYIDNSKDEISLVRNNQDNDFNNHNLININSITLNTQAVNDNQVLTKAYVDQFHEENERSRQDLCVYFYDKSNDLIKNNQDNDFNDEKLTNKDSITANRKPASDNELANKKCIDDSIGEDIIVRITQTLQTYVKVPVGNDTYNLTKFDEISLNIVTEIRSPNIGCDLLLKRRIKNLHENNGNKAGNFLKSTVTSSPTSDSGATSITPFGIAFIYIETSSNNHSHEEAFVIWEITDNIQNTNTTFYYNRFLILTNDSLKSMGKLRIQLLLKDNTWSTRYNIPKKDRFTDNLTDWTLVGLNFTAENYGIN